MFDRCVSEGRAENVQRYFCVLLSVLHALRAAALVGFSVRAALRNLFSEMAGIMKNTIDNLLCVVAETALVRWSG